MKIRRLIASVLVIILLANSVNVFAAEAKEYNNQESIIPNEEAWDNAEAFAGYVEKTFYGNNGISLYGVSARETLSVSEKVLYDFLKEKIERVAAGVCTSTVFCVDDDSLDAWESAGIQICWSAEELGVSTIWNSAHNGINADANTAFGEKAWGQFGISKVIDALLHDCPYELYWFDKSVGVSSSYGIQLSADEMLLGDIEISFSVAGDYKLAGDTERFTTDVTKTFATSMAAENAKAIVEKYAKASDFDKLKAYRDEICSLVSYNHDAVSSSYADGYGDPWQLVYVFDGNTDTNVVCEGYSKAFQYLCDMSTFTSDKICCYTVCGTMAGGTGAGNHMWNVVTMEDGKNYLVDITNSDTGSIGQNGGLFLAGADGSVGEGYAFRVSGQDITFSYAEDSIELWGTDGVLVLAASDYAVTDDDKEEEEDTEGEGNKENGENVEGTYEILVWNTASKYDNYIDYLLDIYNNISVDNGIINCTKNTSETITSPNHFTGTEVLEDTYDLVYIMIPFVPLNDNDIQVLRNYVKAGGRIVLQGENARFFKVENANLTALAQALGTSFTITENNISDPVAADINLKSDLLGGVELDAGDITFKYYAEIEYEEPAEVIASYQGLPGIVDQAVEKGRITVFSDINFYDPQTRTKAVEDIFLRLLLNSSDNKDIVEEGGDPNIGFGEPCALNGSVKIEGHTWTDFSEGEVSDLFFAQPQTVTVTAQDKKCGLDKVYTYISNEVLSEDEITALTGEQWSELEVTDGVGSIELTSEQEAIVYAKITDMEGNVKYISTDKIIVDTTAPVIHDIEEEKTYCQPVSFTLEEKYLDSVTVDGVETGSDEHGKYTFTITLNEHVIKATDKAGNTTIITVKNGHTWRYTASENVIYANCGNSGCPYETEGFTLTLAAETMVEYTAKPYDKVDVENEITSVTGEAEGEISYYMANDENQPEGDPLTSAPSGIGSYVATISLGGQTAQVSFAIVDTTPPAIHGIEDGKSYCEPVSFTVEEPYLDSVTVDGVELTPDEQGNYRLATTPGEHVVKATDSSGNTTTITLKTGHTWIYTASENVIYAKCGNSGCPYETEGPILTLSAETPMEYTAEPYDKIQAVNEITPVTGEMASEIAYYKANEENKPKGEPLAMAPSEIGSYLATISLGGQTAQIGFEIVDTIPPAIHGIESEKIYCEPVSFTVEDLNLDSVTVDGIELMADDQGKYTLAATPGEHVVKATDCSGNTTTITLKTGHTWIYTAADNVIYANCGNSGCPYETEGLILTLSAETPMEYTAESYDKVEVENEITPVTGEMASEIAYYKADEEKKPEGEPLAMAPSEIGSYVATISLGGQTAQIGFEIVDTIPPIIHGVKEDETYLETVTFTVEELNLSQVTVDGIVVEPDKGGQYTIAITKEEHRIEATDQAGNKTTAVAKQGKPLQCTISWDEDGDGQADCSELVEYGVIPEHAPVEKQADYQYTYQFAGWSPAIEPVAEDRMYCAVFTKTLQEYTVKFPEMRVGYEVVTKEGSSSPVAYNGSYSFYVDTKPGYDSTTLVVTVNGRIIMPIDGVYTITAIGCDGRDVQVNISIADTLAPTGSITVNTDTWSVLQKNISFDKFYTTAQTVEIKGVDLGVGIQSISYCITEKEVAESEFKGLSWIPYISKFSINPNIRGIVYAKIVDRRGNETYISTCGLIIEAPEDKNDIWINEEVAKFEEYVHQQTTDKDLKGSFYKKVRARVVSQTSKQIILKWNKVQDADGYIIYGNQCNKGGKIYKLKKLATTKNSNIIRCIHKNLLKGTYYKYTVAAYKVIDGKKKILSVSKMVHAVTKGGKYSNPTGVKVKQKTLTVKVGKKKSIKATRVLPKGKKMKEHTDKFRYESTNKAVATVDKNGRITGKSKGTCYIYVYVQNGRYTTVKVKVK